MLFILCLCLFSCVSGASVCSLCQLFWLTSWLIGVSRSNCIVYSYSQCAFRKGVMLCRSVSISFLFLSHTAIFLCCTTSFLLSLITTVMQVWLYLMLKTIWHTHVFIEQNLMALDEQARVCTSDMTRCNFTWIFIGFFLQHFAIS